MGAIEGLSHRGSVVLCFAAVLVINQSLKCPVEQHSFGEALIQQQQQRNVKLKLGYRIENEWGEGRIMSRKSPVKPE